MQHPRGRGGRFRATPAQFRKLSKLLDDMHRAGEGDDARGIAHEIAHPAGLTSARATALIDFADKRARGIPTSAMLPVPVDPPPQGGNIGGMTPTKVSHSMGFEPGDKLIATRHFSVGERRFIAGQEHTVTRVIGTNQVAIDTGDGTELVIPTFDQSTVRRVPARPSQTPARSSARGTRLTRAELNALLGVSGNTYLSDMADSMGSRKTAAIEMPMASLADTRDMLRDRLANDRAGLAGWGDIEKFESALAKLDSEVKRRERSS